MNNKNRLAIAVLVLLVPTAARADVVWPALYLETRLATWWSVSIGLLVELLVIWRAFALEIKKALLVDLVANAASVLLGIIFIPLAGMVWEIFPGLVFYKVFNVGTFNPTTWAATCIFAVAINAALEWAVIQKGFKLPIGKRGFWILAGANAVSVAVAFGSLFVFPVKP
jgi:hypothetical protein